MAAGLRGTEMVHGWAGVNLGWSQPHKPLHAMKLGPDHQVSWEGVCLRFERLHMAARLGGTGMVHEWVDIFQNPIWKSLELKSMLLGYRDLSRKCPESIWENPETILENLQHIMEWVLKSTATILTVWDVWNIIQEKQNVSQNICKIFWTVLRMVWKTILKTVQKII